MFKVVNSPRNMQSRSNPKFVMSSPRVGKMITLSQATAAHAISQNVPESYFLKKPENVK